MKNLNKILSLSLLAGAIYFLLISIAHAFQIKIPVLFIYFNVPSNSYQDYIISFLAFGWGMFLYAGYKSVANNELTLVKYILISGIVALLGLILINGFADFKSLDEKIMVHFFWFETVLIALYISWIAFAYWKSKANRQDKAKVNSYYDDINREQIDLMKKYM